MIIFCVEGGNGIVFCICCVDMYVLCKGKGKCFIFGKEVDYWLCFFYIVDDEFGYVVFCNVVGL